MLKIIIEEIGTILLCAYMTLAPFAIMAAFLVAIALMS